MLDHFEVEKGSKTTKFLLVWRGGDMEFPEDNTLKKIMAEIHPGATLEIGRRSESSLVVSLSNNATPQDITRFANRVEKSILDTPRT